MLAVLTALAAGAGASARLLLDRAVQRRTHGRFPYGIALVNVVGSLLLGFVLGLAAHRALAPEVALVVGTGFAGGFTTLSTWAWDTLALAESGEQSAALGNAVGSFAAGLLAAAVGLALALL